MHKSYRWKTDSQKKKNKCFPFHEDMYDIWHYEKKQQNAKQNSPLKYVKSSDQRDLKQSIQED